MKRAGRFVRFPRRVKMLGLALLTLGLLAALACSSDEDAPPESPPAQTPAASGPPLVIEIPTPSPTLAPQPTAALEPAATPSPPPTSRPAPVVESPVRGLTMPLQGACLPNSDNLMPNAPRPYRAGVHEGIDYYDGYVCTRVTRGMPVVAAGDGVVVRADTNYQSPTREEMERLLTVSQSQGYTDAEGLDVFRGRQVWIDHGDGVITRYCHLLDVAPGIQRGMQVKAGQEIAYVGNSGIVDGLDDPNAEIHLHFELRIGDGYLGQGLGATTVRAIFSQVFSKAP